MRLPLYLQAAGDHKSGDLTVSLAKCRNCGKTKVASDPCSFDHLAAILEWNATRDPNPDDEQETS